MVVTTLLLTLAAALGLGGPSAVSGPEAATHRPIDNHDGTFTVQAGPVCQNGSGADTMSCTGSGWVEEFTWRTGERYYSRGGPDLYYYQDGQFSDHGYVRFDLRAVPDSAVVLAASFLWYQYSIAGDRITTVVKHAVVDPDSVDDRTLYVSVDDGLSVSDTHEDTYRGWVDRLLNDAGLRAVESCLTQDWITLGVVLTADGNAGRAYGCTSDSSPRLAVTYSPQPGIEERMDHPCLPRLKLSPNPTSSRSNLAFGLPSASDPTLRILNATGRVVWGAHIAGQADGTIQLPLLPSGVYLVRLESDGFAATEKLVVQR